MLKLKFLSVLAVVMTALSVSACSPEVGSEAWCDDMKTKSKGDWTVNETGDYAKHCMFK